MSVTVGIDIGTTSVKAAAFDDDGQVVARARVPHRVVVPEPDCLEHDADQAWRRGPRRALAALGDVDARAVAISSMVPSLTAVGGGGRPVSPGLLYGDRRGDTEAAHLGPGGDGSMVEFLRWTARFAPGAEGYWPATAVASRALGGPAVIDYGVAFTASPLFGPRGWDPEVSASCGVRPDQLPRVEAPGAAVGRVGGGADGAILATGSVDGLCEQLVSGATREGDVHVICGTTLIVWSVVPECKEVPGLWTIPHPDMRTTVSGGASNAGGMFLEWAGGLLGRPRRDERLDPANLPVWTPYPRGERSPYHDPRRRAGLHGLDLTHGPAAAQRAAWEASGFVVRHHVDLVGVVARRIVATGGGTQVQGWMQGLANATGLPVHVSSVPETAAQGAAFMARVAAGLEPDLLDAARWARTARVVEPESSVVDHAAQRYLRFRELSR
ncbi:MAG: xylulokinase [Acidimicrobiales bacterium]